MSRVLVIEDNPASLDLMVYLLKAFGHEPLSARDGLDGVAAARCEHPELIICDIQLPGASGIEVCHELKRDAVMRDTPLVAVTAYAMVGDRERLLSEGFDGYLSKPINAETFIKQLEPYLRHSQLRAIASPAGATTRTRPQPFAQGNILVVDNSPNNVSLSRSMLEPFGYTIFEAGSVDSALKILAKQNPDLILSDLHMPDKDGFDFIEAVKADAGWSKIPFIFISSTLWAEREREHALSRGAARFILRPIEAPVLIAEIENCRAEARGE